MTKLNTKMRVFPRIIFVAILAFTAFLQVDAQTTGKKKFVRPGSEEAKKEEEKANAPSKWGFGINLGNIGFAGNAVNIGLDPNVAYRITDAFAAGFMLKMNYYNAKYQTTSGNLTYTAFDWGPTLFARVKPLLKMEDATPFMQGIFFQGEYERSYVSREQVDAFGNIQVSDDGKKILTEVNLEHYLYIGAGLSSGYPFSSFISFHYNLLDKPELSRLPFTYRIGFTWNY
ncbi:MAG TPA: hypothetical protein VLA46_04505 [Saprospiraceae bacterium]|nr:hypothetical protein [Saprospiraceae bacterium]